MIKSSVNYFQPITSYGSSVSAVQDDPEHKAYIDLSKQTVNEHSFKSIW